MYSVFDEDLSILRVLLLVLVAVKGNRTSRVRCSPTSRPGIARQAGKLHLQ